MPGTIKPIKSQKRSLALRRNLVLLNSHSVKLPSQQCLYSWVCLDLMVKGALQKSGWEETAGQWGEV